MLTVGPVSRSTCEPARRGQDDAENGDDEDEPGLLGGENLAQATALCLKMRHRRDPGSGSGVRDREPRTANRE